MKSYSFLIIKVALLNYFIANVLALNKFYTVSIRRNENDKEYDKSPQKVQDAIDELVNDRMNDIYDIINENKETYKDVEGNQDEKLDELEKATNLRKRNEKSKFRFINKNRPERNKREFTKRDVEYIPFESDLLKIVAPVSNYVVIAAYLSDDIVEKIKSLSNVVSCEMTKKLVPYYSLYGRGEEEKYYNIENIKEETKWNGVGIQERKHSSGLLNSNLSPLSQGVYEDNDTVYDNNYYYPESAGKGIDVYVIDSGWNALLNDETKEDFDTYEGTEDERIVRCEGQYKNGEYLDPQNEKQCEINGITNQYTHGIIVAMSAIGKVHGTAKKANFHMISVDLQNQSILAALDYVKTHATSHKTVINMSIGCSGNVPDSSCNDNKLQAKILELVEQGIIIIVAAGNDTRNRCGINMFQGAEGVIAIGALDDESIKYDNPQEMYTPSSYSNWGPCVVGFAPGTVRTPLLNLAYGDNGVSGTSFAAPLTAGVVATLLSNDTETKYTYETMKNKLIELSIEGKMTKMYVDTPNRIINNGKKTIFVPPKCNDPSGKYKCGDQCCTKYGVCADFSIYEESGACLVENGQCLEEFGSKCETRLCGTENGGRKCVEGECCNNGHCIKINKDSKLQCFIENNCVSEFSDVCLTYDIDKIDGYKKEYQNIILNNVCQMELVNSSNTCLFYSNLAGQYISDKETQKTLCNNYKNFNCELFYANITEALPACKKLGKKYTLTDDVKKQLNLIKGSQNAYCALKDSENYCLSDNTLIYNYDYLLYETNLIEYCPYEECKSTLSLLIQGVKELFESYYEMYSNVDDTKYKEAAAGYKERIEKISELDQLLKSEECIQCSSGSENCDTKRCGKNYDNRHCLEGECCSSEGKCINILEDEYGQCFKENGCISEFSEACLSSDISNIDDYKEDYQKIMLRVACDKEIDEFSDKCNFTNKLIKKIIEDENEHTKLCEDYKNNDCEKFLDNPTGFLPTCQKLENFELNEVKKLKLNYIKSSQNIYCHKKSEQEFCIKNNNIIYDDNYLTEKADMNEFCPYDQCKESIIQYMEILVKKMENGLSNNPDYVITLYKDRIKKLNKKISYLNSDKCNGNKQNEKPASTKTKDNEPSPTSHNDEGNQSGNKTEEPSKENTTVTSKIEPTNGINKSDKTDDKNSGALTLYPKLINYLIAIFIILLF